MITHLSCWLCGKEYVFGKPLTTCECGRPLQVHYKLEFDRDALKDREANMWRYREVLPPCEPISLGEGWTPLFHAPRLGERWYIKDEGLNPTASFKARGMSSAVSMARHFGFEAVAAPSAGNAAGAMCAYAAKAGMKAYAYMPRDTPKVFIEECRFYGAQVELIDGLINVCGAEVKKRVEASGGTIFPLNTLKEPYRVEGKKTMGYEIAEQMEWRLPDVIVYPTGGGTGLVGMWKAFGEMERMGWIGPDRPRMVSVQAAGCAPIATAFENGERFAPLYPDAHTAASGLRVPEAVGDFIMLDLIRASGGTALTVTDEEMVAAQHEIASTTGIFPAPEGGASLAGAQKLRERGFISPSDVLVLFNTGSGLKYIQ